MFPFFCFVVFFVFIGSKIQRKKITKKLILITKTPVGLERIVQRIGRRRLIRHSRNVKGVQRGESRHHAIRQKYESLYNCCYTTVLVDIDQLIKTSTTLKTIIVGRHTSLVVVVVVVASFSYAQEPQALAPPPPPPPQP